MSLAKDFRNFALKGNVIDLAVGVIIGGAFGKITDSLVNDIIMPIVAFLFGGKIDFSNMFITLGAVPEGVAMTYADLKKAGVPMLAYGNFMTIIINFILLAFVIFMLVKYFSGLKAKFEVEAAVPEDVALLREIRDSLKK
jgi:large conductance mechanosensitive channel